MKVDVKSFIETADDVALEREYSRLVQMQSRVESFQVIVGPLSVILMFLTIVLKTFTPAEVPSALVWGMSVPGMIGVVSLVVA